MIFSVFSMNLKRIRSEMGYSSALSFYDYLKDNERSIFNYSYYVKIEAGKVLPSSKVLSLLKRHMKKIHYDVLVASYMRDLIPDCDHLIKDEYIELNEAYEHSFIKEDLTSSKRDDFLEFTQQQVSVLAEHKIHYQIFILLTLARYSLSKEQIERAVGKRCKKYLSYLNENKLIKFDGDFYTSLSSEVKMPKATNDQLRKFYDKFDRWDKEIGVDYDFTNIKRKGLIKRISPKYIDLISKQLDLVIDLIHTSNDLDQDVNDAILSLNLSVDIGRLPG